MKPEPLKDKIRYHQIKNAKGETNLKYPYHYDSDIKSAVEWLKKEIYKRLTAEYEGAVAVSPDYKLVISAIDEAFEDAK